MSAPGFEGVSRSWEGREHRGGHRREGEGKDKKGGCVFVSADLPSGRWLLRPSS